ncbi:hypothetical protein J6590_001433 [Homalodisca vitripennis]|nr:hypothetical protein J6590_001433 [Homalodisca vitripennis]
MVGTSRGHFKVANVSGQTVSDRQDSAGVRDEGRKEGWKPCGYTCGRHATGYLHSFRVPSTCETPFKYPVHLLRRLPCFLSSGAHSLLPPYLLDLLTTLHHDPCRFLHPSFLRSAVSGTAVHAPIAVDRNANIRPHRAWRTARIPLLPARDSLLYGPMARESRLPAVYSPSAPARGEVVCTAGRDELVER